MFESQRIINHSSIALKLKAINVTRLALVGSLKNAAFAHFDGEFIQVLRGNEIISSEYIRQHALKHGPIIFISSEDAADIDEKLKEQLIKLTRSLSVGDPLKNGRRHGNLLTLQMSNLYDDPFNDQALATQYQSAQNFFNLMIKNKNIHKKVFEHVAGTPHHYTVSQPLLSSILLLSFLQHSKMFSKRELENLFLTSYFKDIGMSLIPREKFELADLTSDEKQLFDEHAKNSMKILESRINLNRNYLRLIENHHFLNHKIRAKIHGIEMPKDDLLHGLDSTLLSAMDILVAMISPRPYREATSVFDGLDLLKKVLSDEYPQEFKSLVLFVRQFFKK
jgi:hypothetical protein